MCNKGITKFYLPPTHEPYLYLPLLSSRKASPPFGWYSLRLPTKGWPGWVDLGGWSHTELNVPHRELNPDRVIHFSTNRARRRLTVEGLCPRLIFLKIFCRWKGCVSVHFTHCLWPQKVWLWHNTNQTKTKQEMCLYTKNKSRIYIALIKLSGSWVIW